MQLTTIGRLLPVAAMRSRAARPLLVATLLLGALAVGCARSRTPAPLPPRAVRATTTRAAEGRKSLVYAGGLEPKVKLDLAFGVAGRVRIIGTRSDGALLHEGDPVRKGQLLAQLDNRDLKRQAASARLASSSAASEIDSAQSAVAQADADLARAKKLAGVNAIARVEVEKAESAARAAHARLETTRAQHGAKLEQFAIAERVEGDARLTSPIDGVIARRLIDVGENVSAATIAFTVIDTTQMKLVFAVPDTRIGAVRLGQTMPIESEALPGVPLSGRVTTIHPVADPALRTFTVELSIGNPEGKLRAGMVASAALGEGDKSGPLLVPLASVVRAPGGDLAVFALDQGRASLRPVRVGDLAGNDVAVEAGLRAGERIITDGAPLLHDGERVEVLP